MENKNKTEEAGIKKPEKNRIRPVLATILTSLAVLTLQHSKLGQAETPNNPVIEKPEHIHIPQKQEVKRDKTKEFKSILNFTFALEGHEKGKPITEASYHGNEDFMTTAIGITEYTYEDWQKGKGVESIKPLTEISEEESYQIIREIFWDKIEGRKHLPESIMLMRFQAIWNLGEGRESELWENVITKAGVLDTESINPLTESQIIKVYAKEQIVVSKEVHSSHHIDGTINRINKSEEKSLSLVSNVANNLLKK